MIYIQPDQENSFIRRLNDKRTLASPYFLWELKRETGGEVIYFSLDDTSSYDCAYNLFTLIESTTGSTSGGTNVPLSLYAGQYEYKIYESSASTLSVSATTGIVLEKDMLVVKFDRSVNTSTNRSVYF